MGTMSSPVAGLRRRVMGSTTRSAGRSGVAYVVRTMVDPPRIASSSSSASVSPRTVPFLVDLAVFTPLKVPLKDLILITLRTALAARRTLTE
jgi:hypothetical protein